MHSEKSIQGISCLYRFYAVIQNRSGCKHIVNYFFVILLFEQKKSQTYEKVYK